MCHPVICHHPVPPTPTAGGLLYRLSSWSKLDGLLSAPGAQVSSQDSLEPAAPLEFLLRFLECLCFLSWLSLPFHWIISFTIVLRKDMWEVRFFEFLHIWKYLSPCLAFIWPSIEFWDKSTFHSECWVPTPSLLSPTCFCWELSHHLRSSSFPTGLGFFLLRSY